MYVAALQDSLPHAQALSHKGFNAFVLIYRPGWKTACEDLARAISFLWEHTAELQIDMKGTLSGVVLLAHVCQPGSDPWNGKLWVPTLSAGWRRHYAIYRP